MKLRLEAPARLHLGLLDLNGGLGRLYGSIGVAINCPRLALEAERQPGQADDLHVAGAEARRVESYARRFLAANSVPGALRLRLASAIPAHAGLGSGTQLALAVGTALARLGNLDLGPAELAPALGRATQSGIGLAVFEQGGLVVDGGRDLNQGQGSPPPVLFRHPFPDAWRFIVATPAVPAGLSGAAEERAFKTLGPAPAVFAEQICRLLVMQMLPALLERDLGSFGVALTGIQRLVGDSFAAVQGGRFANTVSGDLVAYWLGQGAPGAGQSSWGPTVYALAGDENQAEALTALARTYLAERGGGEVWVAGAANQGARVEYWP